MFYMCVPAGGSVYELAVRLLLLVRGARQTLALSGLKHEAMTSQHYDRDAQVGRRC